MRPLLVLVAALLVLSLLFSFTTDTDPRPVLYLDPGERQYRAQLCANFGAQLEAERAGDQEEAGRLRQERLELVEEWQDYLRRKRQAALVQMGW